jgi:very-short-patch-repair endonuclease
VVSRRQLEALGFSRRAIDHRLAKGRLHHLQVFGETWRGVYLVGRPELTPKARWMAAALFAGHGAAISHGSAAALLGIAGEVRGAGGGHLTEVSMSDDRVRSRPGLRIHRRKALPGEDLGTVDRIPVTSPARTLIDLAVRLPAAQLERAVNEADRLDLIDPERLRGEIERRTGLDGVSTLRRLLDRRTFVLTRSELERLFLPLARRAGLGRPETQAIVNGFEVDFWWPRLGLVVETDGLRYHRTPAEQARDRLRDQAHVAAGLTPLRFTHAQIKYEPGYVEATLRAVVERMVSAAA